MLFNRATIMGIVNATPDSFSGEGTMALEKAVQQGVEMLAAGADILDVGGESTRPTAECVTAEEEKRRVLPVIRGLRQQTDAPISIDTYKASVAAAALDAGATMINDVWGGLFDAEMLPLATQRACPIVLTHNSSNAPFIEEAGFLPWMETEMQQMLQQALAAGIAPAQILLDVGIGFGKTVQQNLLLVNNIGKFAAWGYPLLLGTSRKSFIGAVLDVPVTQRLEGTLATLVVGRLRGAHIFRVHDVTPAKRALQMVDALLDTELSTRYS